MAASGSRSPSVPSATAPSQQPERFARLETELEESQFFECRVTQRCGYTKMQELVTKLEDDIETIDALRAGPFGNFTKMQARFSHSNNLAWALLVRSMKGHRSSEMWFVFKGTPIRLSLKEYALITGMNCSAPPNPRDPALTAQFQSTALKQKHFPGVGRGVSPDSLEKKIISLIAKRVEPSRRRRAGPDLDIVKLMNLLFVVDALVPGHKRDKGIDQRWMGLADDIEMFNNYPWGYVSFQWLRQDCIKDLAAKYKTVEIGKPSPTYTYCGFLPVFTVR